MKIPHTALLVTKGIVSRSDCMHSRRDEVIVAVSETAADVLETPLEKLPPLSDAIDPDALCAIVSSRPKASPSRVTVAFDYASLEIFVSSDNMIFAQPISSTERVRRRRSYRIEGDPLGFQDAGPFNR
jgi:hypothetical protein